MASAYADEFRVGDALGEPPPGEGTVARFPRPALEAVVYPLRREDQGSLRAALNQLAEQDPLIDVRQDDHRHEIAVSLYGEVQKEVIQATLSNEYGVDVRFRDTTTICVERPVGVGSTVEVMGDGNPFRATVGLRIEPSAAGSGSDRAADPSELHDGDNHLRKYH